jgi:ABC-type amino acid transport substrate-binding protein
MLASVPNIDANRSTTDTGFILKRFVRTTLAAMVAILALPAYSQSLTGTLAKIRDTGTITIGHREASIPFSYLDDKQQAVGYAMDICARVVDAIKAELNLPNLKLQFDIYHRQILHGDIVRGLEAMLPITGHIQIASVPARAEPASGELDDLHILQTIEHLGYRGFIGCEYKPANGTLAGLGWLAKITNASEPAAARSFPR